ncbi:nucleotide pyrophosphatase/phosphodiesterase family protein [Ammonicoccus fulvus]|uniref:Nucleotide pyrophosphatase/phosphodiesterase family protein n=1 Tax=Ammonicoccus fulvus TaxID=3138240 RepID=A0ABZ3FQ15_9ACTN
MTRVLLLDVVGLTAKALAKMPRLSALARQGAQKPLDTVLPAVTCSVQSTLLTGRTPAEHGIVGNGWYFRELGEVFLWRQHNALVQGPKVWDTARARQGSFSVANICWWYAMGMDVEITVTPRPIYHADGRKSPDCYTRPPALHDELTRELGAFPLFQYWGAGASIVSTRWIAEATKRTITQHAHDLVMAYLPHLDYDLQRFGPDSPQADAAAAELDEVIGELIDVATEHDMTILAVSEYGIAPADQPVDINRMLRRAGLLEVYNSGGHELLDPWTSRAFAVADHQVAHVYVRDAADRARVAAMIAELPGVDEVLDREAQQRYGIHHERSGDLVAVAAPGAWFTYYYWLDDAVAPDFARGVDIHRKPGYDPAELFLDPADKLVKAKAGLNLLKKKVGLRYTMNVVPLDPTWVKGTHGRLPDSDADRPVFISSNPDLPGLGGDSVAATAVHDLILAAAGVRGA